MVGAPLLRDGAPLEQLWHSFDFWEVLQLKEVGQFSRFELIVDGAYFFHFPLSPYAFLKRYYDLLQARHGYGGLVLEADESPLIHSILQEGAPDVPLRAFAAAC